MKQVAVCVSRDSHAYQLFIGSGITREIASLVELENYTRILVFVDSGVKDYANEVISSAIPAAVTRVVGGGESQKYLERVAELWKICMEVDIDRHSLIINVGGGALCDVGAFVASTFMRGVATLQVPTTLLAQVDASIGGKTGFNLGDKKNLIGTFYQPIGVIIDTLFLKTLAERELRAGMAEIVKHGIIASPDLLKMVSCLPREWSSSSSLKDEVLIPLIEASCRIKARIVMEDEKETTGVRKLLNFGHTFGHAFESLSHAIGCPLLHGEAVAIGMVAESILAAQLGLITESDVDSIVSLLSEVGLPTTLPFTPEFGQVLDLVRADKKNKASVPHWSLPTSLGSAAADVVADEKSIEIAYRRTVNS